MIEKFIGIRKARQLHRLIRHFKVTVLCLILTVVVLRGTIGAGKFGTPEQDFLEIRNRFASRKFPFPHRVLEGEVEVDNDRNYSASAVRAQQELRSFHDDDDDDLSSSSSSSFGGEGVGLGLGRGNVIRPNDDELALFSSRSSSLGELVGRGNVIRPNDDDLVNKARSSSLGEVVGRGNVIRPNDDDELQLLSRSSSLGEVEGRGNVIRNDDDDDEVELLSRSSSLSGGEVVGSGNVIKPRVLLVTGLSRTCGNSLGDYYLLKSVKNKIDYCRLHGMEILYNVSILEAEMSGFRAKLMLIRNVLLGHPETEFVWWMDSDVLFTDMAFEVPWERYKGYDLVMHGSKEVVVEGENWVGLNTGSFLIRNCRWSLDLIESWSKMGPRGKVRVEGGEISVKELKTRVYLSVDEKKWGGRVYLENDYYIRGFWEVLVRKYEKMLKNYKLGLGKYRWPLVTQFVGCKPCSKVGDHSNEKCLKEMERAFNFGDNQVVGMYGFTHNSLSGTRVKQVQDDMLNHQAVKGKLVTEEVTVSSS